MLRYFKLSSLVSSVVRRVNSAVHRIVISSNFLNMLKNFSILELKSLFISCEFNIPGVIDFLPFYCS